MLGSTLWAYRNCQILAPLTDNSNAPNTGKTPIYQAALNGHTEIVKILVPLTNDPNALNDITGKSPVDVAKNDEIRTILESFKPSKKRIVSEPPKPQSTKRSRKQ